MPLIKVVVYTLGGLATGLAGVLQSHILERGTRAGFISSADETDSGVQARVLRFLPSAIRSVPVIQRPLGRKFLRRGRLPLAATMPKPYLSPADYVAGLKLAALPEAIPRARPPGSHVPPSTNKPDAQ